MILKSLFLICKKEKQNNYLTYIDVSNLDVSNVIDMALMFYYAGYQANYLLDLNSWKGKISQVQDYRDFDKNVRCKLISPFDDSNQQCYN